MRMKGSSMIVRGSIRSSGLRVSRMGVTEIVPGLAVNGWGASECSPAVTVNGWGVA